jgi:hypothetical protein
MPQDLYDTVHIAPAAPAAPAPVPPCAAFSFLLCFAFHSLLQKFSILSLIIVW